MVPAGEKSVLDTKDGDVQIQRTVCYYYQFSSFEWNDSHQNSLAAK